MTLLEKCISFHTSRIQHLWDLRDGDDRILIRQSLRKLREIRDNGDTLKVF